MELSHRCPTCGVILFRKEKLKDTEDEKEIRRLMVSHGCNECVMLRGECHINCTLLKEKIESKKEEPKEKICANCKFGSVCARYESNDDYTIKLLKVECHYLPTYEYKEEDDFCSKFGDK